MKKNKVTRKCIVSKKIVDIENLIRIVKTKENEFFVNSDENGRGAYISKNADFELLKKRRLLNRAFKQNVPDHVYTEIEKILKGD